MTRARTARRAGVVLAAVAAMVGATAPAAMAAHTGEEPQFQEWTEDAAPDLLALDPDGRLRAYESNGSGGWRGFSVIGSGFWDYDQISIGGDWTGDGYNDIIARHLPTETLQVFRGSASGPAILGRGGVVIGTGWSAVTETSDSGLDTILAPGDWDGDGHADLIARRITFEGDWVYGDLFLYRGNGTGGFSGKPQLIGEGWANLDSLTAVGDFTGDGASDLVARNEAGNLFLYPGNGSGGFQRTRQIGTGWGTFYDLVGIGDFDGDGANDIIADAGDTLRLYPGSGTGGFKPGGGQLVGTGWGNLWVR